MVHHLSTHKYSGDFHEMFMEVVGYPSIILPNTLMFFYTNHVSHTNPLILLINICSPKAALITLAER